MSAQSATTPAEMLESVRMFIKYFGEEKFEPIMQDMFKSSLHAFDVDADAGESLGQRGELYFAPIDLHKKMCQYSKSARR